MAGAHFLTVCKIAFTAGCRIRVGFGIASWCRFNGLHLTFHWPGHSVK